MNIAGRAGRWSASHWKTAFLGWVAFVALAIVIGGAIGLKTLPDSGAASGDSAKAEAMLQAAGFKTPAGEDVLVQSSTLTTSDPAFRAAVNAVVAAVRTHRVVYDLHSPLAPGSSGLVSKDGHSALVDFKIRGTQEKAPDVIQPVMDSVAAVQAAHPSLFISEFGVASANHVLNDTVGKDFHRAEVTSVPVTLVILLVAFGALAAAGLPVLLALSAVLATLGLAELASHVVPASGPMKPVILLIGMAVGVDYSLFYLRRYREERASGVEHRQALLTTASTSGQAVLISGGTVLIAMAGMLFTGSKIFTSIAVGAILMVGVALVGSLSVLPALLSKLGDRINKGRLPFVGRRLQSRSQPRVWGFVVDRVLRRPLVSAVAATAVLLGLAAPALSLHTQLPSFTDLPKDIPIVKTYDRIQLAFPGAQTPALVVVGARDVTAPSVQAGIAKLKTAALKTGEMSRPIFTRVSPDKTVATVSIPLQGNGNNDASKAALQTLRQTVIPATIGAVPGTSVAVTGQTAGTSDFNQTMKSHAPLVFAFVLGLVFLLLLLTFRSIVIPIKAVILNLLSVAAAYGVLVAIFQHSWAQGILGFHSNGAIASWLPLFLFVILFGLSMDYHVFIVSRIKEEADKGVPTAEAVGHGIKRTAGVVTSAAVVMVAVFAIFATLHTLDMKQLGVGLAVAILIDATLIRAVLLPATMKLLGEWNWYLPRWLEWLPRFEAEGREPVPEASVPDLA